MSLIIENLMSEGLHDVTISSVEDLGRWAMIYFKAGQAKPASLRVIKSLDREGNLFRLLSALDVTVGETVDLNTLVDIRCQIVVQHKEKDGKTYANVAAMLPKRRPRRRDLTTLRP